MNLSERLQHVAKICGSGRTLADIGCDHAYLGIWLVSERRFERVIAMDLREGPLMAARRHVEEEGLSDKIECRLSDGCDRLDAGEADVISFAGMGGPLMISLLKRDMAVSKSAKRLVLQPQSEIPVVRQWLKSNGFRIEEEDIVCEDGKFYPMMAAVPGEWDDAGAAERLALAFGGALLEKKHPVLRAYLEKNLKQYGEVLSQLRQTAEDNERRNGRIREVEQDIADIREALKVYET
ncbi:MAG: class I SAM-dependent methyltransferase [Lachnospiraceae bacterium]|nr:class I SAM-dependent methyltransferase [Lachnospiraceae bacterium]